MYQHALRANNVEHAHPLRERSPRGVKSGLVLGAGKTVEAVQGLAPWERPRVSPTNTNGQSGRGFKSTGRARGEVARPRARDCLSQPPTNVIGCGSRNEIQADGGRCGAAPTGFLDHLERSFGPLSLCKSVGRVTAEPVVVDQAKPAE